MRSINSKMLSGLIDVSYELSEIITARETFHPKYKANRDTFRKLIAARLKIERSMRKYFRGAKDRIYSQIDWAGYQNDLIKATEYIRGIEWENERLLLTVEFSYVLPQIYELGIEHMEQNTGITTGLSSKDLRFQKEIKKHGLDLAKGLTQTTKERVRETLRTSMSQHKPWEEAAKMVDEVVNDKNRSRMIARTETVNGHSKGILTAGRELGARRKRWLTAGNPCPICAPLDGVVIPIDNSFPGGVDGPTLHPYCLCLVENVF